MAQPAPDAETVPTAECGVAAALVGTARHALGIGTAELAAAAGCDPQLVLDIEHGRCDPAMDTVDRILNGCGLELRAGPAAHPNPAYASWPDPAEVARIRHYAAAARTFRAQYGLRPPGPPPGTQPDWDGSDPAPPRRIGAGPSRRCSGGWGHLLTLTARPGPDGAFHIPEPDGSDARTASGAARALAADGLALHVRIETYDDHDDILHLAAEADPDRHDRLMAANESAVAGARQRAIADRAAATVRV